MNLEQLFDVAQQYGNVDLFQDESDRAFSCTITFMTIKHTKLQAESGWKHRTPSAALIAAIQKAEKIAASLSQSADQFKHIERLPISMKSQAITEKRASD